MTEAPQTPALRIDEFLTKLPVASLAREIAGKTDAEPNKIERMLNTYINEARVSFSLVEKHLSRQSRILEIGAGLCLLSLFLKREGFNIIALEPALGGYGLFDVAKQTLLDHFSDIPLEVLTCPAQELNAAEHGSFDLIFSNNVIEHIPDWQAAMSAMGGLLSTHGMMRHSCPNYTVPYEPHYGIPVFRHFPKLSRRLFLSSKADPGIWDSLNFIRHKDVKTFCAAHALSCNFEKALLYKALMRIDEDPVFKSRHKGLVATLAGLMVSSGLVVIFKHIPPSMATPMIIEISRQTEQ